MGALISDQTLVFLIYCGVAVGVLIAFTSLVTLASRRETTGEVRSRRLRMIREGRTLEERLALLKPPSPEEAGGRIPVLGKLTHMLRRADLTLPVAGFLAACAVLALVIFAGLLLTPLMVPAAATVSVLLDPAAGGRTADAD